MCIGQAGRTDPGLCESWLSYRKMATANTELRINHFVCIIRSLQMPLIKDRGYSYVWLHRGQIILEFSKALMFAQPQLRELKFVETYYEKKLHPCTTDSCQCILPFHQINIRTTLWTLWSLPENKEKKRENEKRKSIHGSVTTSRDLQYTHNGERKVTLSKEDGAHQGEAGKDVQVWNLKYKDTWTRCFLCAFVCEVLHNIPQQRTSEKLKSTNNGGVSTKPRWEGRG